MRITNIDTISALFDRLITEKIKLYFFEKQEKDIEAKHQKIVIGEIKIKLEELLSDTYKTKTYDYVSEKRTFDEGKLIDDVETLIQNDLDVGDAYYTKTDGKPTLEKFIVNESRLRMANESRGRMKNDIDKRFKSVVEGRSKK
jgi:hypothetical protein